LQSLVPGLTVKTGEQQNQVNYAIRGQTLDAFSGSSPGVLPYVNDVQVSSETAPVLYDLESIQVLKGPQGTLFGRNAIGGAVLYNTAKPTYDYDGYLTVRAGQYDLAEVQGAANLPIVDGKAAIRFAGDYTYQEGYVRNLANGDRLGTTDAQSGRITLLLEPWEGFSNITVLQAGHYGGTELMGELYSIYPIGATNNGYPLNTLAAELYPGPKGIVAYLAQQHAQGAYNENLLYTPLHRSTQIYIANTTTYKVSDDVRVKNILSVQNSDTRADAELAGGPFLPLSIQDPADPHRGYDFHIAPWSEELQVIGDHAFNSHLNYIAGLYAAAETDDTNIPVCVGCDFPTPLVHYHFNYKNIDSTRAIYSQGTYDLGDLTSVSGLSFTAGFRYTWEELYLNQLSESTFLGAPSQTDHESSPSWNLGLQYQLNSRLLLYFVNRGSWRAGNFNGSTTPGADQDFFKPEHTIDYEVGEKYEGSILGKALRVNFSIFDQRTRDIQKDVYFSIDGAPSSFTHNVPEAEVKGAELEVNLAANKWLTLGLTAAYDDAKYTKPNVVLFGQDLTFTTYPDTPMWTGSLYATAFLPTPSIWGPMSIRADAYQQSSQWYSSLGATIIPGTQLPGYGLVNLRYDWKSIGGSNAAFAVYVKNALDRLYFTGGFPLGGEFGMNTAVPGAPRMIAGEVTYRFK
jgi:iron complex outermembrane receptor protein